MDKVSVVQGSIADMVFVSGSHSVVSLRFSSVHFRLHSSSGGEIPQPSLRAFGDLVNVAERPPAQAKSPAAAPTTVNEGEVGG